MKIFVCVIKVSSHLSNHLEQYFSVFAQSFSVICLSAQREHLLKMVSPLNSFATKSFTSTLHPAGLAGSILFRLLCVLVIYFYRTSMFLSAMSVHANVSCI